MFVVGIGDNKTMNLAETIHVAPAPLSPLGMTPSALALSADQKHLYVACSDADAVASVDVSDVRGVVEGFLPAGAYPAAVRVSGDRVWVANARGNTVDALGETFRPIADPPELELAPAEHVIYVIRDNQPEAADARDRRARAGLHGETRLAAQLQHRRPRQHSSRRLSVDQRASPPDSRVRNYGVFVRDGKAIDPAAKSFTKPDASAFAEDLKQFESSGMMPRLILVQIAGDEALASLKSAVAKSRFAAKTEIVVGDLRRVEALLGSASHDSQRLNRFQD